MERRVVFGALCEECLPVPDIKSMLARPAWLALCKQSITRMAIMERLAATLQSGHLLRHMAALVGLEAIPGLVHFLEHLAQDME